MGAAEYFRSHWGACAPVIDLSESLAATAAEEAAGSGKQGSGNSQYKPHLGPAAIEAGLDSGALLRVRDRLMPLNRVKYYVIEHLTMPSEPASTVRRLSRCD